MSKATGTDSRKITLTFDIYIESAEGTHAVHHQYRGGSDNTVFSDYPLLLDPETLLYLKYNMPL